VKNKKGDTMKVKCQNHNCFHNNAGECDQEFILINILGKCESKEGPRS
jgi:hypothetical protein